MIQLGRNLAMEWGPYGIRVNTISPGYIVTAMVEALFQKYPERKENWPTQNMLGRLSRPEEYRGAAAFLISDASSFMTGESGSLLHGRKVTDVQARFRFEDGWWPCCVVGSRRPARMARGAFGFQIVTIPMSENVRRWTSRQAWEAQTLIHQCLSAARKEGIVDGHNTILLDPHFPLGAEL